MQCVLGSARKSAAMHKLPLSTLFSFSDHCKIPKVHSMNPVGYHRPKEMVTGHWLSYWPPIVGRSALKMVGRPNLLQNPVLTAAEGKTRHGNAFQANVCTNTSLIMFMTQRDMVLDSRTTNRTFQCVMAQETKYAF